VGGSNAYLAGWLGGNCVVVVVKEEEDERLFASF
jgi:hypothetical protein